MQTRQIATVDFPPGPCGENGSKEEARKPQGEHGTPAAESPELNHFHEGKMQASSNEFTCPVFLCLPSALDELSTKQVQTVNPRMTTPVTC